MDSFGSFQAFSWTKDYLYQVLTTGKSPMLKSDNLKEAFAAIDRADFLPESMLSSAYTDVDLEFAFGEKTSSPVLVAQMLEALKLKQGDKVLELGTGAGYSLALIALAVSPGGYVYSVERNQQVSSLARSNLAKYKQISNYEIVFKDGETGLVSRSPFDAIHVSFAYESVPEELMLQLKVGGRLVVPMTNSEIHVFERQAEKEFSQEVISARHFDKFRPGVE